MSNKARRWDGVHVAFDSPYRVRLDFEKRREKLPATAPPRPEHTFTTLLDELVISGGDIRKKIAAAGIAYVPNSFVIVAKGLIRFSEYLEDQGGEYGLSLERVREELGEEAYEELLSCILYLSVFEVSITTAPTLQRNISKLVENFVFPHITSQVEEEFGRPRSFGTGVLIGPRSSVTRATRELASEEGEVGR